MITSRTSAPIWPNVRSASSNAAMTSGCGSAARAHRVGLGPPGVAGRWVEVSFAWNGPGELVQVQLGKQDRARPAQGGDRGRVLRRHPVLEQPGVGRGADAGGGDAVLDSEGDAPERAATDRLIGGFGPQGDRAAQQRIEFA